MKKIKIIFGIIIIVLCLFQINSYATVNLVQTHQDGIYKIVSSEDINKSIEMPGGSTKDNIQFGIWDYRKWKPPESSS